MTKEVISARAPSEFVELVDEIADHHNMSRSQAGYLLMFEGLKSRQRRHRLSALDNKIDKLFEALSLSVPEEAVYRNGGRPPTVRTPAGGTIKLDLELNETPHEVMGLPDTDE